MKGSIDQSRPRARRSRRRAEIMAYSVKRERQRERQAGGGQGRTGQCSSRRSALESARWPSGERAGAPRAAESKRLGVLTRCGRCSGGLQQFTAAMRPLDLNLSDESE